MWPQTIFAALAMNVDFTFPSSQYRVSKNYSAPLNLSGIFPTRSNILAIQFCTTFVVSAPKCQKPPAMGNRGSTLNCTQGWPEPVEAEPDVAGIEVHISPKLPFLGVYQALIERLNFASQLLLAFILNAVIAFGGIVSGYLLDSVPDDLLTNFNQACLAEVSQWWQQQRS